MKEIVKFIIENIPKSDPDYPTEHTYVYRTLLSKDSIRDYGKFGRGRVSGKPLLWGYKTVSLVFQRLFKEAAETMLKIVREKLTQNTN